MGDSLDQEPTKPRATWTTWMIISAIILAGLFVRTKFYLADRSFWTDEASVAMNLRERDYMQLTQHLDHHQSAPVGFLWAEKAISDVAGLNEFSLRFLPLVVGCLLLILIVVWAALFLDELSAGIIAFYGAFSPSLVYFSSELKPYITDAFFTTLVIILACVYASRPTDGRLLGWAIAGQLAVWCSYPSVFALASSGATAFAVMIWKRDWKQVTYLVGMGLFWLVGFACNYFFIIQHQFDPQYMNEFWGGQGGLNPDPANITKSMRWVLDRWFSSLANPFGFTETSAANLLFWVGMCFLIFRRAPLALMIAGTMGISLCLGYLGIYPYQQRLIIFLIPLAIIVISFGISQLILAINSKQRLLQVAVGVTMVTCLSLMYYQGQIRHQFFGQNFREETRPLLEYLEKHRQPDETLIVLDGLAKPAEYYRLEYPLLSSKPALFGSVDEFKAYRVTLSQETEPTTKAWLIFGSNWPERRNAVEKSLKDNNVTPISTKQFPGIRLLKLHWQDVNKILDASNHKKHSPTSTLGRVRLRENV